MPRILVVTSGRKGQVVMDELVQPAHLDDEHSATQILERLAWGIEDAVKAEARFRAMVEPRPLRSVAAS